MQSPTQGVVTWVSLPWQSAPPSAGAGLVQVLVSVLVPPPQVAEQAPATQADQPPSTRMYGPILPISQLFRNFQYRSMGRDYRRGSWLRPLRSRRLRWREQDWCRSCRRSCCPRRRRPSRCRWTNRTSRRLEIRVMNYSVNTGVIFRSPVAIISAL